MILKTHTAGAGPCWITASTRKKTIEKLSEAKTLIELEALKDQLPQWMWKEVVARTQLRLKFADEKWEELTPDERSEYLDRESQTCRDVMIE